MKKKTRLAALLLAVTAASSCVTKIPEKRVTFHTVNTKGIDAYVTETEEPKRTVKPVSADGEQTSPEQVTCSYETAVPEALTGNEEQSEETEVFRTTPYDTEAEPIVISETVASAAADTAAPPPQTEAESDSYAKIGENGILVIRRGGHYMGLMGCWGTYGLCESWAKNVNKFKQKLPDVNVYNAAVPTSSEFYVPADITGFTASQKSKADHVAGLLENVVNVDVYPALTAHLDERIYARTDHHWLPLGAYYAAGAFAEAAGVSFPDISEYKKVTAKNYVGSMYGYSKDIHLYNDPEDFDLYIPPNDSSLKTTYYNTSFGGAYESRLIISPDGGAYYCSFLGSDDRIAKIETDCKNGRTLVMFKESYGNGMVPFLTSSFETIYVCDLRYFNLNAVQFCKDVGATDLLFAVCTFTVAGTNGNYLSVILNN